MMRALAVIWGLFVDDLRLALGVVISIIVAAIVAAVGQGSIAAAVLAIGVLLALTISVRHEARKKK